VSLWLLVRSLDSSRRSSKRVGPQFASSSLHNGCSGRGPQPLLLLLDLQERTSNGAEVTEVLEPVSGKLTSVTSRAHLQGMKFSNLVSFQFLRGAADRPICVGISNRHPFLSFKFALALYTGVNNY
jgi:hypothetical protein